MADTVKASVRLTGREELELEAVVDGDGVIQSAKLTGIGGPRLLEVLREFRPKLKGKLDEIEAPSGATTEEILLRELILRAQGRWEFPYSEDELCHCRVIPTAVVDQAICTGAHTSKKVSALTSASTACGTCRPNVEAMIKYRLGK